VALQWRQASDGVLPLWAASMSIGTGLPGDRVTCAKRAEGAGGSDLGTESKPGREESEAGRAHGSGPFAPRNHASGLVSEGLPEVMPASALEMW
jgi:hypothetical protein